MQIPKDLPTLFYNHPPHEISPLLFLGVEMDILWKDGCTLFMEKNNKVYNNVEYGSTKVQISAVE